MRRLHLLGRALALMACIPVFILGGFALASSQGTSQGTISACVHKSGGGLYVGRCARGDKTLSWSQRGRQGPRGPVGPQGPAGPGAVAINDDGIPNGTTLQLWTNGAETLSLGCQNQGRMALTAFVVTATEPASVNGFRVFASLDGTNPGMGTFGAPVGNGLPATLVLGSATSVRNEGQLEIAKFGLGAAVYTFSFHEHVDNSGGGDGSRTAAAPQLKPDADGGTACLAYIARTGAPHGAAPPHSVTIQGQPYMYKS